MQFAGHRVESLRSDEGERLVQRQSGIRIHARDIDSVVRRVAEVRDGVARKIGSVAEDEPVRARAAGERVGSAPPVSESFPSPPSKLSLPSPPNSLSLPRPRRAYRCLYRP